MILTALSVIFIYTPETFAATQQALSNTYVAFTPPADASAAVQVGVNGINALIMVSVICAMTFLIVLLYKYRCLKLLIGYMIFASAALLGLLGQNMFREAINAYNLAVDQFSFYFTIWNFAPVGTAAIFSPWGGFPTWVTQGYLIATSVILAWQLAAFDPWVAWPLLIMLALYDLCAVLTPCGPLKALVNLMMHDDAPSMPGLLYEAELPPEAQRPGRTLRRRSTAATQSTSAAQSTTETSEGDNTSNSATSPQSAISTVSPPAAEQDRSDDDESKSVDSDVVPLVSALVPSSSSRAVPPSLSQDNGIEVARTATDEEAPPPPFSTRGPPPMTVAARLSQTQASAATLPVQAVTGTEQARGPRPRATLPFAIAKLYKLPLESEEPERRGSWTPPVEGEQTGTPNEMLARQYTPEQLKTEVTAIFPRNGGRIEQVGHRYMVKDRHGNLKRVLLMNEQGHVLEERQRTPEEQREEGRKSNSIKLGLVSSWIVVVYCSSIFSCIVTCAGGQHELTCTFFVVAFFRETLSFIQCSCRKPSCTVSRRLRRASWSFWLVLA